MLEKIRCPELDSNPRHPDLMKGAPTTMGTSDFFQHFFCINRRHVRVDLSDDEYLVQNMLCYVSNIKKRDLVDAVTKLETSVLNFHNVSGSLLTLKVLKA